MSENSKQFTTSANEQLKQAFKMSRDQAVQNGADLPGFQRYVSGIEDEYNCPEGMEIIRNTWYGRKSDYKLTRMMETYAFLVTL